MANSFNTPANTLAALSNDLADAVARAAAAVVAVHGRPRTPSTGIIWRKGIVVTTDHTLQQDEGVTVEVTGGKQLQATIAGRDPRTDIAALRVPELDSPAATFGDSAALRPGHIVLALGRGVTASLGVVSATGGPWRTWRGGAIDLFIRPDVSIYTGFSGGPLVDSTGAIVGLNTSALARGSATSLPVVTVDRVLNELLARGRVAHGYLGVGMQPIQIPEKLRGAVPGKIDSGLLVVSVEPGGPADNAGLFIGDVLVAIDDRNLGAIEDLQESLSSERIGKPATLTVLRGGRAERLTVTIGERP